MKRSGCLRSTCIFKCLFEKRKIFFQLIQFWNWSALTMNKVSMNSGSRAKISKKIARPGAPLKTSSRVEHSVAEIWQVVKALSHWPSSDLPAGGQAHWISACTFNLSRRRRSKTKSSIDKVEEQEEEDGETFPEQVSFERRDGIVAYRNQVQVNCFAGRKTDRIETF